MLAVALVAAGTGHTISEALAAPSHLILFDYEAQISASARTPIF